LLVDATCDLPQSIYERYGVHTIPTFVQCKKQRFADSRDLKATTNFYEETSSSQIASAKVLEPDRKAIRELISEHLIYKYDHLLVLAPHIKNSDMLKILREEIFEQQPFFEKLRLSANLTSSFKIRLIETNTSFTGYGLMLYEALRLMHEKARSVDQLKTPLDKFKQKIECYLLPGPHQYKQYSEDPFDLNWLAIQKLKLGKTTPIFKVDEAGLSLCENIATGNIENLFLEYIYDQITRSNFESHLVNVSYAGKLSRLRVLPRFKSLHEHVKSRGGKLVYSMMSISSAIQLGEGAISISFSVKSDF